MALLTTGCEEAVVAAPTLTGDTATQCADIVAGLPEEILGVSAHSRVTGTQVQWGDPPLVLTCGVEQSAGVEAWSKCSVLDGVQWFIDPQQYQNPDSDVTVETLGTEPIVRLDVPLDLRPRFDEVIGAVTPTLKQHLAVINACE